MDNRLLRPEQATRLSEVPKMQHGIPLYDDAQTIAKRIHEKTLEEIAKMKGRARGKDKPVREQKPKWLKGGR
uniref:Uncharacterized protein n=1 Tax=viral metagenome TaxID=1070528 RepID=A0A6H1ZLM8_9ZZZZ